MTTRWNQSFVRRRNSQQVKSFPCKSVHYTRKKINMWSGKPYWREGISTTDLLVLASLNQLLFILKILFNCVVKQVIAMRGSMVLSLPVQLVFPDIIRSKIVDFEFLSEAHRFLKNKNEPKLIFFCQKTLWTSRSFSGCFVNSWSKTLFNVIKKS